MLLCVHFLYLDVLLYFFKEVFNEKVNTQTS